MAKDVTLHLDDFGHAALERLASRRDSEPDTAVMTACLYYLRDRESGRAGWPVARFTRADADATATITVTLDGETWNALRDEAERQGVPAETLALHAVMYFIADLDSGRVADRLEDSLEDRE